MRCRALVMLAVVSLPSLGAAQDAPGDRMLANYFRVETAKLRDACLTDIKTLKQWTDQKQQYREELLEMLGLEPMPPKTDLLATVTGATKAAGFRVENIHFQSRPGLYVTGNLYLPDPAPEKPAPAILYVCGHGRVKKNGVSYGNKTHYQHHGAWFARNGYVCLTIDTLQLGEIEGVHHGTYSHDRWWWLNRGYTPAGVEAWNCIRALDYLETRREVDPKRFGVTGRSGGGAYSWWIAAIDERIRCAVPVAGITDLENHVVDGCVEGHCDCMFMVNTFRWDYAKVAALVAPRPLLISNTDRDGIFPLDGVVRTHAKVREIYRLYDAEENLALQITAGPHKDTQELRVHAFRWFNHHLRGDDSLIETTATKFFEPESLRALPTDGGDPSDQANTTIDESFVSLAPNATAPDSPAAWKDRKAEVRRFLDSRVFAGWPGESPQQKPAKAFSVDHDGLRLEAWDFVSQESVTLRLYLLRDAKAPAPKLTVLNVHDELSQKEWLAAMRVGFESSLRGYALPEADKDGWASLRGMLTTNPWAMAYVAPRGIGRTAWNATPRKQTQHRRRFYLLGQSLDGMRVYDVRRAIQTIRSLPGSDSLTLWLQSQRQMGAVTLYASLYEPSVARIDLHALPHSHDEGPFLLNIRRITDLPEVLTMAAEQSPVVLYDDSDEAFTHARETAERLQWDAKQFRVRRPVGK